MKPTVMVVNTESLNQALEQINGINRFNTSESRVIIKVGIYNPETSMCTTVNTVNSLVNTFDEVSKIRVVESDSGAGPGLERLKLWKDCYNERVKPFNLSQDENTNLVSVAGENVPLSHVLFKPNVFISTHVPRRFQDAGDDDLLNVGSIIKNLLGLIPDKKKYRFHKRLPEALLDMYEAIGGIDLAVLDSTHVFLGKGKSRKVVSPKILLVGKDAVAVEAVGAHLMGFDPSEMSVLQEAKNRGLGETDINQINVIGDIEPTKRLIDRAFNGMSNNSK
ncbi:MAG: DUF362 domain-containing protein [Candidatus Hodarchaeales archaeon]|jgi:uncharacterized protein (DUF362 family)